MGNVLVCELSDNNSMRRDLPTDESFRNQLAKDESLPDGDCRQLAAELAELSEDFTLGCQLTVDDLLRRQLLSCEDPLR